MPNDIKVKSTTEIGFNTLDKINSILSEAVESAKKLTNEFTKGEVKHYLLERMGHISAEISDTNKVATRYLNNQTILEKQTEHEQ